MDVEDENVFYYLRQADAMKNLDRRIMFVDIKHLLKYDENSTFTEAIFTEYYR